ncbi:MAG TPA: hypothetical protein PKD76_06625 [Solirubrobacterales bacterium]|nr:hypothetical protein [Solirubrobacterales bacterium]
MALQPQQTSWTDERLDDLNQSIRDGFGRNDRGHQEFRQEMREMRAEMNDRFDRMSDRFDSFHRVMIVGLFSMCGAILASVVAGLITLN